MNRSSSEAPQSWTRSLDLKRYVLLLAAAWTLAIGVSLAWTSLHERGMVRKAASVAGRREFAKDVLFRRWNAGHGGVYAPVSESTPPNPHLAHVEEREIETPSGRRLTLINPAYMTRQVHELGFEAEGVRGHITSLNPIRPANAPDAWEKRALETFERGEREFSSVEMLDGEAHLRLMRPLMTEKGCLKCHADQGYKEGDVRGGISVSMPMAPYAEIAREHVTHMVFGHGALWLLGLAALAFGSRRIRQHIRERDRAEEMLRENEQKYRLLVENQTDLVIRLDLTSRFEFVSPSFCRLFGMTSAELIGAEIWPLIHPDDHAPTAEAIAQAAQPPYEATVEIRAKVQDDWSWIACTGGGVLDDAGSVVGVTCVGRDVTERRVAEEALRESEQRFRDLAELLPQTVYEVDLQGRLTFVNRNAFEMFGFSQEDLEAGLSNLDVLAPEDRQRAQQNMECVVRGENFGANEYVAQRKDGSRLPIVIYSAPIMREDRPAGLRGIIVDITERKRAEEALRRSEERLRTAGKAAYDLIFEWDVASDILEWIGNIDGLLGYGEGEISRDITAWLDLIHPEDRATLENAVERHRISTEPIQYEYRIRHKDGAYRYWNDHALPLLDDKGRPYKWIGVCTDITNRKRAEEDKLALERQVQHAQKLKSLGVLAGGIAHDFNNLLTAILGNADLALNELSPMSPARHNLREIGKASKRAADLAKQMLAYSGKGRFVVQPISGNELVEEMAHLLEVSISKKTVLKYNFAENLPTFDGDVTQIRQVVMNLITNASEAIGERTGVIALSTGAMHCDHVYLEDVDETLRAGLDEPPAEGMYTYFEVADTGCGMDAETLDKIFDPFFTTKFTGRGLGMSAVLGIVRGHKGALKIRSDVGKGTTFKVLFPANELPEDGVAVRGNDEAEGKDWRGSGTVLIADDEAVVRAVGQQMLERLGFSVLTASDGREALEVFGERADEIVCVLLDLTMPHMDGEEAFREMQRLHPGVRVILCSGYNEQDATQRFAGKGLAGFIQKPFTMTALKERIVDALAVDEGEP